MSQRAIQRLRRTYIRAADSDRWSFPVMLGCLLLAWTLLPAALAWRWVARGMR